MTKHRVAVGRAAFMGAALVLAAAGESTARATTIIVNATNTVAGDGKCSFDEAVNALNQVAGKDACPAANGNNDTISLPAKSTPYNASISGTINKSVTIMGAGASSTTLQFASPDDYEVSLWLSGPGTVTLKNLTMQQSTNYILDGLSNYGMTVNISGAVIKNFHWVGVRNESSNQLITIASSTLSNNLAGYYSDAGGSLSMTSSIVSNNSGWGIEDYGGTVTITSSTVSGNGGGGVNMAYATLGSGLTMSGSIISGNGLSARPQYGGGLCNFGHANIDHSSFEGNSASWGGGIYSNGQLFLSDSTLGANSAASGGGLFVDFLTPNSSESFYFEGTNNTIAFNQATQGGGMELYGSGSGNTSAVSCTIVADNTAPTGPDVYGNMANTSLGFLVTSESGATNVAPSSWIVANPLLGSYSSVYKTYPLLSGSPAINICTAGNLRDYGAY